MLVKPRQVRYSDYPHFPDGEIEAREGWVACALDTQLVLKKPRLEPRKSGYSSNRAPPHTAPPTQNF